MSKYIELKKDNFEETTQEGVVLIDFWATWCGPCRILSPIIDDLSEEFEGKAKICKVNTDEEDELTTRFGIRSIPTIIFMKDGEIVETFIGAQPKQKISEKLEEILKS